MSPELSIVMTNYNNESYIGEAIRSVLDQTYQDWELIIVDDGSNDRSCEVVSSFHDERIHLERLSDNGQISNARNVAVALCRGRYIAILDSDDAWKPTKIEKQISYMNEHPEIGLCFTTVEIMDENSRISYDQHVADLFEVENRSREEWIRFLLTTGNHFCNPSVLMRREVADEVGDHDICLLQLPDYDYWLRALRNYDLHVIQEPLMLYRRSEMLETISSTTDEKNRRLMFENAWIINKEVRSMNDNTFVTVFRDYLVNPSAAGHAAVCCEKAVLLASDKLVVPCRAYAYDYLREIINDSDMRNTLENEYHINQHDIYRLTGTPILYDQHFINKLEQEKNETIFELQKREHVLQNELEKVRNSFNEIEEAFFWKITKPARVVLDNIKKPKDLRGYVQMSKKTVESVRNYGIRFTAKKIRNHLISAPTYTKWMKTHRITDEELERQRKAKFERKVLFSITVPLYNTPETFLKEMIDSVIAQTYSGWELCMADGSDVEHQSVERICMEYARKDARIKYKKLTENLGISGNTNACLGMASGDYIALFDHDDVLHPAALYEIMQLICEKNADIVYTDEATFLSPDINNITVIHFKPDFAPDNLKANNYICHFTAFKRSLLEQTGLFRSEYDGSQDHDMILRLTEKAKTIEHISKVLYFWRAHPGSVALTQGAKDYTSKAGIKAVTDSIERMGISGEVMASKISPSIYRIRYDIAGTPKVSIIIPTCDHIESLSKCIESIEEKTTYKNYEIILVENNSKNEGTFDYYETIKKQYDNINIITWTMAFNYSAINNYGVKEAASGDYILLLNNDTEIITPNWIEEMLMFAQREDVGAVGAKLLYPDDTIQHGGVLLGKGGIAAHLFEGMSWNAVGYMGRLCYQQNLSAVTGACMLIRKAVWDCMHGLDEGLPVAFNDVDLCMRIRKAGYLIVWTPFAELYHYESLSRGRDDDTPEKIERFQAEQLRFRTRWSEELEAGDPYYNPNFIIDHRKKDFSI